MSRIQTKVYYHDGTIRRVSLNTSQDFSLSSLTEKLAPAGASPQDVRIKYKDTEGDMVLIGSDAELLDVFEYKNESDPVLRLYVSLVGTPSEDKSPELNDIINAFSAINPFFSRILDMKPKDGEKCHRARRGGECPFFAKKKEFWQNKKECKEGEEQRHGCPRKFVRGTWRRGPFGVHRFWRINHAVKLMDDKKYAEAEEILNKLKEESISLHLVHYNLACIYSLTGRTEEALEALSHSVANGYSNVAWMREDPDLEAIRSLPRFEEIVRSVPGYSPEPAAPQEEIPVFYPETEAASPASETHEESPVKTAEEEEESDEIKIALNLLRDMGFGDDETNKELLKKLSGDVSRVINALLSI